uniref:Zinc finger protein 638 isoform X2 n=1 Tax=Pogona vitticeps TaxID=103695 RepID=A0ABM5GKU6_9SAUR
MFNPRGNMHPRTRGPNVHGPVSHGPFQRPGPGPGPRCGPGALPRQPPPGPTHRMPQRFMGPEMRPGFPRSDVQISQHRMDPRQAGERMNMERQQKEEGCGTHWDNSFSHGGSSQNQPNSGRMAEHTPPVQSRYTSESASSILASFGLSNEDLEELSRYPDDQLTPENMPLILRDIRMRKVAHQLPSLPSQSREKEAFCSNDGRGSMVKSKVIDYGHESKYVYTDSPLEVKIFDSDVPDEGSTKGFQAQQTASVSAAPSTVTSKQMNAVEELIRQMGFQRSTPSTPSFPPMDTSNKGPGLSLPSAGAPPTAPPMISPVVPPIPPPSIPPAVQQALPPSSPAPPVMPAMNQLPPPFRPEILGDVNRSERIHHESRARPPGTQPEHTSGQKKYQKEAANPIESPFGVVKASWLPVFSQADAQKMKRFPTPSMMNDYYAASPRILPHMCSLCNVECRHMKDWIEHQNTTTHLESCRQLCQQYPDWNPESHCAAERRKGDIKENHSLRRRSASYSPKRSVRSSSGHARYRTRSRSRSPRYHRTSRPRSQSRPRSRSPRWIPGPRYRSRSPWRPHHPRLYFPRSSSRERRSGKSRSPDSVVLERFGPQFLERYDIQKSSHTSSRERLATKKALPEQGKTSGSGRKTSKSPPAPSKRGASSHHGSSGAKAKLPPETTDGSSKGGVVAEGKTKKPASGSSATGTEGFVPSPYSRLLSSKAWSCGTVLRISDLPDDGYNQQDIKKLVQPFGKVSDIVVLRTRKVAYLVMNYKEAVIAAVKYGETVPVLINKKRVKISVAEKPKAHPTETQGSEKKVQSVKKSHSSTKKEQAKPPSKSAKASTSTTSASKSNVNKPAKAEKVEKAKSKVEDQKKSGTSKTTLKAKKPAADSKKSDGGEKASKSKKTTEPKKVAEPGPPTDKPAAVPDKKEMVKSTEAGESVVKDPEEMCVVVISSLPEAGLTQDEIFNLAKPFGKVKDFLFVSSHKKAYIEISRKSADSMVKFYTCFPMWVEKNQLCITLAPEFKDLRDEEAIFIAMIKDANPNVNTENLYTQFVHLGNLPDGGYSELEILCVGLRFGRVDHYMVITNKNKALLQLDSSESAASMCRFLKRYPYSLGESQLTFSRSPKIESLPAEAMKKEVRKQELSKDSPDLKTIPEGSGVVHPSTVPSPKATEAKKEPSSNLKTDFPEPKTEQSAEVKTEGDTEKEACEAASKPVKSEMSEEDVGTGVAAVPPAPVDLQSPGLKLEETLAASSSVEEEKKATGNSSTELSGHTSPSVGRNPSDKLATPGKTTEELQSLSEKEVGSDSAGIVEAEDMAADAVKTVPQVSTGPSGEEEVSGVSLLLGNKLLTPEADSTEATTNLLEKSGPKVEVVADKESDISCSTTELSMEVEPETVVEKYKELAEKSELAAAAEGTAEKQPGDLVPNDGAVKVGNLEKHVDEEDPEQMLSKTQPSKEPGQVKTNESCKTGTLAATSAPGVQADSAGKTPIAVSHTSKTKATTRRKEGQKPALEASTRSRVGAEKKPVLKERSQDRPMSSKLDLSESGRSKLNPSSLAVELGSGKSSSQQNRDPQVETKGSLKQTRERENRSSSLKRDNSSTKVSTGRSSRRVRSSAKPEEEEELSPFNLDEFVTMDEVVDEADSPSPSRRNPVRGKRKDPPRKNLPYEPSSKRKKGKVSAAHAAKSETSFVTLDEIGEDEDGVAQVELASLEAIPDPQVLVTVDEVNDEEELMEDVIKDPQSLVTLDEISEQEEPAVPPDSAKDAFALGDQEPDLKAEPLVTVDEIGEIEELPLDEPSPFKDKEDAKPQECEKQIAEDPGDVFASQMPDDPSALVTVDEIHEDSDDQPLVTLDEVTEDDEDFLEDFNRLKEELNFVTVDEVGSGEEEEKKDDISASPVVEEPVTKIAQKEETTVSVAEEEAEPSSELEEIGICADNPKEESVSIRDELCEGHVGAEAETEGPEKEGCAAQAGRQEDDLEVKEKEEGGEDVEGSGETIEAHPGREQLLTEPRTCEESAEAEATEMEAEEASESPCEEKEPGADLLLLSADLDASAGGVEMAGAEERNAAGSELPPKSPGQPPEENLKSCSEAATPSQPSEKPKKVDTTESEGEGPESKRKKIDSAEKGETPSSLKDLDFLVPRAGYFCQICSSFCVDEASMKTHCQSELHKQNMEKFMVKNAAQEEQKGVKEGGEEESSA